MKNITEVVKYFEDAQKLTKRPDVPAFNELPADLRKYFQAHYKMTVIAEALNEEWKADWSNSNQKKWYSWFYLGSSGFAFDDTYYSYSSAPAGHASRLCFKSSELAEYAGKHFINIWNDILTE